MCIIDWLGPVSYIIILAVFIIFVVSFAKRNRKLYEDQIIRQKEIMDRQKESIEVLREIRDLLKNK